MGCIDFGNDNNRVDSTVSGSWTRFGVAPSPASVMDLQAIYWDGTSGKDLKIKDAYGDEIYHVVSDGTAVVDLLVSPITVRLPLTYLTDEAGKKIRIWGHVST